jgi:hypothetical protein
MGQKLRHASHRKKRQQMKVFVTFRTDVLMQDPIGVSLVLLIRPRFERKPLCEDGKEKRRLFRDLQVRVLALPRNMGSGKTKFGEDPPKPVKKTWFPVQGPWHRSFYRSMQLWRERRYAQGFRPINPGAFGLLHGHHRWC